MNTSEPSGVEHERTHSEPVVERRVYGDEISFRPLILALWGYRRVIAVCVGGAFLAVSLWAIVSYAFQPVERRSTLEFRLLFDGAGGYVYPNGLPFSTAEIIGAPVLTEVFDNNQLDRYSAYESFKNRMFVVASSPGLALLGFEYQARLTDPTVSAVDRERLEEQFLAQREAMRTGGYSLNFISPDNDSLIPEGLLAKAMGDVLNVWAEQAVERKGVLSYPGELSIVPALFEEVLNTTNHFARADMLRTKVNGVIERLNVVGALPGANVARAGESRVSLAEARSSLQDLLRYRLEPLVLDMWRNGDAGQEYGKVSYLENRTSNMGLDLREAEGKVRVLEDSLRAYLELPAERGSGFSGEVRDGSRTAGESFAGATTIMPQLEVSFLDRIIGMAQENDDRAFRQALTNQLIATRNQVVSTEREVGYYEHLSEFSRDRSPISEDTERLGEDHFSSIYDSVIASLGQADGVYREVLAQNLNPRTSLFAITSPFSVVTLRAISLRILFLPGLLALGLVLVVVPLACLIHHYYRREILGG